MPLVLSWWLFPFFISVLFVMDLGEIIVLTFHSCMHLFVLVKWFCVAIVTNHMPFFVSDSPSAHANSGGQLQEKHTTMTRRNDSYLPVPSEEKNLDSDFISKAKIGESVVRCCPCYFLKNAVMYEYWFFFFSNLFLFEKVSTVHYEPSLEVV